MKDRVKPSVDRKFSIALPSIKSGIEKNGFAIWKDTEFANLIEAARIEYLSVFKSLTLHPQTEPFGLHDLENSPWRKLCIGGSNGLGDPYAQFLTTTYFHQEDNDFADLSELFNLMIYSRNSLTDLPIDFGRNAEANGYWNACRIHHYPKGGGFMSRHRDTHFPAALKGVGLPFLQVMACMSKPGEHFATGGSFLHDKSGEKILIDNPSSYGSLVFFDGSIEHGVDTVDVDVIPDFTSPQGRVAAFVNLYNVL